MKTDQYPFIPKSTRLLERGQFWAIPLPDGTYGAGCVIGRHMSDGKQSTRAFIAGVLAWHDNLPPTPASLLGKEVIKYAFVHIKTIVESGNEIIGKADIKLEGLPESAEALSVSTWGYNVPVILAQKYANEIKCS